MGTPNHRLPWTYETGAIIDVDRNIVASRYSKRHMEPWEAKAHRIIAGAAYAAWRQANHDRAGKRYRKHRPYVLPDDAHKLVAILGWHDRKAAEHAAKAMFQALVFRPVD